MSRGGDTEEENRAYESNQMEIEHKMRPLESLPVAHPLLFVSCVLNTLFARDSSALFRPVMAGYKTLYFIKREAPHSPIYPAQCHLVAALAASRCGLILIFIIAQQQIPFTISHMAAQGHLSVLAPFVTTDPLFSSNTMLHFK